MSEYYHYNYEGWKILISFLKYFVFTSFLFKLSIYIVWERKIIEKIKLKTETGKKRPIH